MDFDTDTDFRQTKIGDPLRTIHDLKSLTANPMELSPLFGRVHRLLQAAAEPSSPRESIPSKDSSPPQSLHADYAVPEMEEYIRSILKPDLVDGFLTVKTDTKSEKIHSDSAKVANENDHHFLEVVPMEDLNFTTPTPRVGIFPNTIAFAEAAAAADAVVAAADAAAAALTASTAHTAAMAPPLALSANPPPQAKAEVATQATSSSSNSAAPSSAPKPLLIPKRRHEENAESQDAQAAPAPTRKKIPSPKAEDKRSTKQLPSLFNSALAQGNHFLPKRLKKKYKEHLGQYGITVSYDKTSSGSYFVRSGQHASRQELKNVLLANMQMARFLILRDFFEPHAHFSTLEYLNLLILEPLKVQGQDWYVVRSSNPDCQSMVVSEDALRGHFAKLNTQHKLAKSTRVVTLSGQLVTLAQHQKQPSIVGVAFNNFELAITWCNYHGGLSLQPFDLKPMATQKDSAQPRVRQKGRVSSTQGTVFNPYPVALPIEAEASMAHVSNGLRVQR